MPDTPIQYRDDLPPAVRSPDHPVIVPRTDSLYWWESLGTFNPGVAEYKGQVVLLYRAYDKFRISRLGLAHSSNGIDFTQYKHPVIDTDPDDPFERLGIEDPRITFIDGTYYIVHTSASYHSVGEAADVSGGMDYIPWRVRVGMHTTEDFHSFKHHGVIISDIPAKNACLLPEKINGNFGLYYREHSEAGELLKLVYTKDFQEWGEPLSIAWPESADGQRLKMGTGSQPIAIENGFLIVYHAVDKNQVYRLGLLLFARDDPTRILWYSGPILEPEMSYEKKGYVPNVVYSCGAVVRGGELWIYYGAADRVIGRAVFSLESLYA